MGRSNFAIAKPNCKRMKNKPLLYGYVLAASFGAFVVGLNLGGISGALEFLVAEFGLSAMAAGLVTGVIMIGCLIGALFGGRYSDKYGRKNIMILSAAVLAAAALGCALAPDAAWLIAARFAAGCGMGILSAVIPIYISEISPARWRGTFVSFYQLFIVIGILAAYCADFGMMAWTANWRWMLGLPLPFAVCNLSMLAFLPESPRWLVRHGAQTAAHKVVARMGLAAEDAAAMLRVPESSQEGGPGLSALFRRPMAYVVLLGSLLAAFQQITGINVIINYAPEILRQTGIGGDLALMRAIYVGMVNFLFTVAAVWLVDRWGRKKLLLWGCAGLVVSLAYLAYAFAQPEPDSVGILAALLVYIAFFAVSLSPLMFVVTAEIYPSAIRGTAMALSTGISWACAFLVVQFFPVMLERFGASAVFAGFGALSLAAWVFIRFRIPETKGRSLEEIEKQLLKNE